MAPAVAIHAGLFYVLKASVTMNKVKYEKYCDLRTALLRGTEKATSSAPKADAMTAAMSILQQNNDTPRRVTTASSSTFLNDPKLIAAFHAHKSSTFKSHLPLIGQPAYAHLSAQIWSELGPRLHLMTSTADMVTDAMRVVDYWSKSLFSNIGYQEMLNFARDVLLFVRQENRMPDGLADLFSDIVEIEEFLQVRIRYVLHILKE